MAVAGRLDAIANTTGRPIAIATMDAGYAYAKVFKALEDRDIEAIVPAKAEPRPGKVIPTRRFRFDLRHNIARCPRGKVLRPKGKPHRDFQYFHASSRDCSICPLRARCLSPSRYSRVVVFNLNHPSLLRARRKRLAWGSREQRLYQRHRWRVEGVHGEAKTWQGLARAVRRGLDNMRIQAFLTAAAINLKRLATALIAALMAAFWGQYRRSSVSRPSFTRKVVALRKNGDPETVWRTALRYQPAFSTTPPSPKSVGGDPARG
jgi:hypothetical protein